MNHVGIKHPVKEWNGDKTYDWEFFNQSQINMWESCRYDEEKYWGGFPKHALPDDWKWPEWCVGPFVKHPGNPIFRPDPNGWDCGNFGGGVRNGSVFKKDGKIYYLYRGEFRVKDSEKIPEFEKFVVDYQCDIGLAVSEDGGFTFQRAGGPFFKDALGDVYGSFEDVCCVKYENRYYMYMTRWDFRNAQTSADPSRCGVALAVSDDLINWDYKGLVFPGAKCIHRNACVLQDENNNAARDSDGRFVMYLNNGLIAFSEDLLHWDSNVVVFSWPGGEGCFALCGHDPKRPKDIVLFTGGSHTGHFYAIGEVLLSMDDPARCREVLPSPVLCAGADIPYEMGYAAEPPHHPVSYWRDSVFFTGLTRVGNRYHIHYTGSEYYTSMAFAPAKRYPTAL